MIETLVMTVDLLGSVLKPMSDGGHANYLKTYMQTYSICRLSDKQFYWEVVSFIAAQCSYKVSAARDFPAHSRVCSHGNHMTIYLSQY